MKTNPAVMKKNKVSTLRSIKNGGGMKKSSKDVPALAESVKNAVPALKGVKVKEIAIKKEKRKLELVPGWQCARPVKVTSVPLCDVVVAALGTISRHGLNTVPWTSSLALKHLRYARKAFEEVDKVIASVEDMKLGNVMAGLYEIDVHLAAAAHHALWAQDREICSVFQENDRALKRTGNAPSNTAHSRFWVEDSFGYRWQSGDRSYICLWEVRDGKVLHSHRREYLMSK